MSTQALSRAKTCLFPLAGTRIGPQLSYVGKPFLPACSASVTGGHANAHEGADYSGRFSVRRRAPANDAPRRHDGRYQPFEDLMFSLPASSARRSACHVSIIRGRPPKCGAPTGSQTGRSTSIGELNYGHSVGKETGSLGHSRTG